MFSPQFMKFLINYDKCDEQVDTKKEIRFKPPKRGKLAPVTILIK